MSQEITELKAAVDHGVRMYAAFANAQALVGALASAENYQAEVQARIDALKQEEAALIVSCNSQREITANEITHAESVRKAADDYAAQVQAGADAKAADTAKMAVALAEEREHAADAVVKANDEQLAAQNEQLMQQEGALAELNAKIAEAQATIAKLLGK